MLVSDEKVLIRMADGLIIILGLSRSSISVTFVTALSTLGFTAPASFLPQLREIALRRKSCHFQRSAGTARFNDAAIRAIFATSALAAARASVPVLFFLPSRAITNSCTWLGARPRLPPLPETGALPPVFGNPLASWAPRSGVEGS